MATPPAQGNQRRAHAKGATWVVVGEECRPRDGTVAIGAVAAAAPGRGGALGRILAKQGECKFRQEYMPFSGKSAPRQSAPTLPQPPAGAVRSPPSLTKGNIYSICTLQREVGAVAIGTDRGLAWTAAGCPPGRRARVPPAPAKGNIFTLFPPWAVGRHTFRGAGELEPLPGN